MPDVSLYRWERVPRDADGFVADTLDTPPDLIVEILSPGQRVNALIRRGLWFVGQGVRVCVLADPYDLSLVVFRAGAEPLSLRAGDRLDLGDVVLDVALAVDDLLAALRA